MDMKTKVAEIAKSKNMSLGDFYEWLLQETEDIQCCTEGKDCIGKEFKIDSVTFNIKGHCRVISFYAKEGNSDYELVTSMCDY